MAHAKNLGKEINDYLSELSGGKKKAVLTVVKTFAEEKEHDLWDELPNKIKASVLVGMEEVVEEDVATLNQDRETAVVEGVVLR